MGAGLAQIGIILVLTVIGLPLFFFGLMAALDRFERSLSAQPRTVTQLPDAAAAASADAASNVIDSVAAASTPPVAEPAERVVVAMPAHAAQPAPASVTSGATKPATAV